MNKLFNKLPFMALLLVMFMAGCGSDGTYTSPIAQGITNPVTLAASLDTYALTTSSGLTTSGVATFGGNVAMDAPTSTCTATPASVMATTTPPAIDSCGLDTTTADTTNPAVANPLGLTITGTTIRYFLTNGAPFNATVRAVKDAANAAWLDAFGRTGGTLVAGPGALGGKILLPGVYTSLSTMTLGDGETLTLDAGAGNANAATAVWIFQVGTDMTITGSTVACTILPTVCTPTQVVLKNGALARNVFWQVGTPTNPATGNGDVSFPAATGPVENNTIFRGTILAGRSVTFAGGTAVEGRVLAGATLLGTPNGLAGAVTTSAGSTGPVTVSLPQ